MLDWHLGQIYYPLEINLLLLLLLESQCSLKCLNMFKGFCEMTTGTSFYESIYLITDNINKICEITSFITEP